jgi:hypothetical protein
MTEHPVAERIAVAEELASLAASYARESDPVVFARCVCKLIRLYGEQPDDSHIVHIAHLADRLISMAYNHGGSLSVIRFAGYVAQAYLRAGGLTLLKSDRLA